MAINRDKVLEAAQKYVEKKKYDKAVVEYRRLIEADPNDARTQLKIGDLLAKQSLYADAISTYETVGKLYAQQGFALKAIAVYKQIRELIAKHVPQLEERYGHITPKLAELYQQLGLTSDALAALDEVATRLQRQQRDQEAIEVFRKIVELDPTNPLPHLRLAEAFSRVKDTEGAVFEFKTAASQLAGIGRRDDALKVLERLLHHRPDPEQARITAELYLSRGQPQDGMQALSKLQICFQANPRDFDTLSLLARAFNAIGQGAKAIEVQKEMARVARDAGKTDLLREIVERLLRVAPQDEGVRKLATQLGQLAGGHPYRSDVPPPAAAATPYREPPPQAQPPQGYGNAYGASPAMQAPLPAMPYGGRPATAPLAAPLNYGGPAPSRAQPQAAPPPPPRPSEPELEELEEVAYEEVEEDVLEAEAYEPEPYHDPAYAPPNSNANAYADANYAQPYEPEEPPPDLTERLQKVLEDANAFRRVRLYAKALDTLRGGLELEPRSMDLHEVYRDILIESGQTEDAVQEMLAIATLYIDALDGESAARALQDVLAFDPQNERAIAILQELGYEIVDENEEYAEAQGDQAEALPAYDLEGGGDDAFAAPQVEVVGDDALPSFPLDEPDSHYDPEPHSAEPHAAQAAFQAPEPVAHAEAHPAGAEDGDRTAYFKPKPGQRPGVSPAARHTSIPPAGGTPSIAAAASRELEDALDEADFFCSRGLFDDARAILDEQLLRHPNNPLLRERIAELDAQDEARGSGAREKPREQDRAFDIAASLDALEGLEYGEAAPAPAFADPNEQVDVEEVFAKFKEGVAAQISVDDSDSHYNLGIAYKEMMLLDDAIREFETAARDPKRECVCRSMIGMIQIERGNLNEAIDAFLLGLNAPVKDPQQETVLCFEIGVAYEAKKLAKDALSYYQKAMRRDPNYRDVQERVRRLAKATESKAPLRQAAVGADDEFDRAFEDLVSKA